MNFLMERQADKTLKDANATKGKFLAAGHGMGGSSLQLKMAEIARSGLDSAIDLALGQLNLVSKKSTIDSATLRAITEECLRTFLSRIVKQLTPSGGVAEILRKGLADLTGHLDRALQWFDAGLLTVTEPQVPISMTNTIHIGSMVGGSVQQGSPGAVQNVQISIGDVTESVNELEALLAETALGEADRTTLQADIATIKAQLAKPTPSKTILAEAGSSIRSVIENLVASAVLSPQATQLVNTLGRLLGLG